MITLRNKNAETSDSEIGKLFKVLLNMGESLTLKLSGIQRILKFEIENCWDIEKVKKQISLIADSKSYLDYFKLSGLLIKNSLYANNLASIEFSKEMTDNLNNLLTIKPVCDKVISNINVTFSQVETSDRQSFAIYDQDQLYLT